jgi:hypothetical protein
VRDEFGWLVDKTSILIPQPEMADPEGHGDSDPELGDEVEEGTSKWWYCTVCLRNVMELVSQFPPTKNSRHSQIQTL